MMHWNGVAATLAFTAAVAFTPTAPAAAAQFNIFGIGSSKPIPPALAKQLDQPISAKLVATLSRASHEGLTYTGKPAATDMKAIAGPRLTTDGKVGLLYIGADFCPYCAGERWGLMLTLLRFGKFAGVRYMVSSSSDEFANTPTMTFQHARFESPYVAFQAVETADRLERPLTIPNKQQVQILTRFDAPPYVPFAESIPFVYVDGKYILTALLVSPKGLDGKNWQQIADAMTDPKDPLFREVMPRVNLLTAAICGMNGNKPADVCTAPGVFAARHALPAPAPAH